MEGHINSIMLTRTKTALACPFLEMPLKVYYDYYYGY